MNSEQQVKHGIFPFGEKNDKYARSFVGQSYLSMLAANPDIPVAVANVSFEPGCRNNWHVHTDGYQILIAVAGEGWYQEEGQPGDETRRCGHHTQRREELARRHEGQLVQPRGHHGRGHRVLRSGAHGRL